MLLTRAPDVEIEISTRFLNKMAEPEVSSFSKMKALKEKNVESLREKAAKD